MGSQVLAEHYERVEESDVSVRVVQRFDRSNTSRSIRRERNHFFALDRGAEAKVEVSHANGGKWWTSAHVLTSIFPTTNEVAQSWFTRIFSARKEGKRNDEVMIFEIQRVVARKPVRLITHTKPESLDSRDIVKTTVANAKCRKAVMTFERKLRAEPELPPYCVGEGSQKTFDNDSGTLRRISEVSAWVEMLKNVVVQENETEGLER
ncbi:uncharacterized protein RAG0_11131 [Rhynchosporium agropyri]|uniref:Uncharacterized protein n=1 Tax=Rhynchosporium agropyri TaxID=914238 RepID=A0A1E1L2Z3_9HELO|nr:uncharacterized protein RAG0_11131 [Rhynchosporium agropyri]